MDSIIYIEIPANNFDLSIEFYCEVFNWEIKLSNLSKSKYGIFSQKSELAGGLDETKTSSTDGVFLYLKVSSIDHTLEQVEKNGGKIIKVKHPIGGGYGMTAIFQDPSLNMMGLLED
jgi:predicted enzyme related to lactoylglutathione lyase